MDEQRIRATTDVQKLSEALALLEGVFGDLFVVVHAREEGIGWIVTDNGGEQMARALLSRAHKIIAERQPADEIETIEYVERDN